MNLKDSHPLRHSLALVRPVDGVFPLAAARTSDLPRLFVSSGGAPSVAIHHYVTPANGDLLRSALKNIGLGGRCSFHISSRWVCV